MINWNRVNELKDEIGEEDFSEVVELFILEVDEEITNLKSVDTAEGMKACFHFLKGCALNLGFSDLSEICQTLETATSERRATGSEIDAVIACYDSSKVQFLAEA